MNIKKIESLLKKVSKGSLSVDVAMEKLKALPYEDMGFATLDSHRHIRQGFPEVIMGEGKSAEQIISIMDKMIQNGDNVLATRVSGDKFKKIKNRLPDAVYHDKPASVVYLTHKIDKKGKGVILVVSAGTSDIPVAEEACITCEMMGNDVERMYDVGVAGIHRVFNQRDKLLSARVIVVVAGMEGALPSVIGGIVDKPIIAVPTSIGYGAHLNGFTALLAMLNSCAAGVSVVNIDNGFGAGYAASLINRL